MKKLILNPVLLVFVFTLLFYSCKKETAIHNDNYSSRPSLPATVDNYPTSGNDHLATLGRVLFYDRSLSLNNSVSCGSCHQQSRAFCDNQQFSTGLEGRKTARNTPSIFFKNTRVFWDGRSGSMNDLALRPVRNHVEMKFENIDELVKKLADIDYYPPLFQKAFPFNNNIDSVTIKEALVEFLKNFNFSNNKFNRSQAQRENLSASEKVGELVFFNKGRCINCHHIESKSIISPFDSIKTGYGFAGGIHNIGLDKVYSDNGSGSVPGLFGINGGFVVPVLLNVEYTAPYMHDGRFKTLEEVVEHYNSGIQNHPNLDIVLKGEEDIRLMSDQELIKKYDTNRDGRLDGGEFQNIPPMRLHLTPSEKKGLVDFLRTLSDPTIFSSAPFSNPFVTK